METKTITKPAPESNLLPAKVENLHFPTAVKVADRNRTTSKMSWQAYRKAHGITADTDKAVVKLEQNKFMLHKKQSLTKARAIGAMLVAGGGFDLTVDTWKNKAGDNQFMVRGYEAADAQEDKVEAARKEAAAAKAEVERLKKLLTDKGIDAADAEIILEAETEVQSQ